MADVTQLFKATIKAVKVRQKSIQIPERERETVFAKRPKLDDNFDCKAREIVKNITTLKEFLLEHRKAYLSFGNYLDDGRKALTDVERDRLDVDAEEYTRICHETLEALKVAYKKAAPAVPSSSQRAQHRQVVLALLETYLKAVCRLHSEQRAIRVKRAVDHRRIGRLEPEKPFSASNPPEAVPSPTLSDDGHPKSGAASISGSRNKSPADDHEGDAALPESDGITEEEAREFMLENQQLFNEFSSMSEEVKRIECKVVEISKLQELFTEKVLEQDKDIDRIGETLVNSTTNIMSGNEDIREAMKNNAGLRVYVLFFLLVMSFTLLFLDWYND